VAQSLIKQGAKKDAGLARSISPMLIHVHYVAKVGAVCLTKSEGEFVFFTSYDFTDEEGHRGERWDERLLDAYAIRAAFEAVKTEQEALEFLG